MSISQTLLPEFDQEMQNTRKLLECVPDAVARMVTDSVPVPTIGIGAGRHCDGQVLVYHDLLGLQDRIRPKFVRTYAHQKADAIAA